MTASDLCYFNFKTRKGSEINWYLKNKVGCTRTTRDGNNFVFSGGDSPGIIYLPKIGGPPKVTEQAPKWKSRLWYGVMAKTSQQYINTGHEQLTGFGFSFDDISRWMLITGRCERTIGIGAGVTGGLSAFVAAGIDRPSDLNGHVEDDFDFDLDIGGPVFKVLKEAGTIGKYTALINLTLRIGAKTPSGFRKAIAEDPRLLAAIVKTVKGAGEGLLTKPGEKKVLVIDMPIGTGLAASIFYGKTTFTAFDVVGE